MWVKFFYFLSELLRFLLLPFNFALMQDILIVVCSKLNRLGVSEYTSDVIWFKLRLQNYNFKVFNGAEKGRSGRRVGINWRNVLKVLLSSSFAAVTLNHDLEVALTQSDIKINLTLYCLCPELIYIQLLLLNLEVWGFLHETAHQLPREGTWVITRCVVHLYIRKKYELSV